MEDQTRNHWRFQTCPKNSDHAGQKTTNKINFSYFLFEFYKHIPTMTKNLHC